jgi:hypothetical protein
MRMGVLKRAADLLRLGVESDLPTIATLDELNSVVARRPDVCVRYSRGPDDDSSRRSVDYESGLELPGLSTIPLVREPWWTRDPRDWLARQLCHYVHLKDSSDDERRAWLLAGKVVGRGPDREPLLEPWTAIAWVSDDAIEEARARYRERFDTGRDSVG